MNPIRETVFDLLLNAILQIGFFAIVAAASRALSRRQSKVSIFLLSRGVSLLSGGSGFQHALASAPQL